MIRLIRIGGQICEGNEDFAFWDTVRDRFVDISGDTVWSSRQDFEECCAFYASIATNDRKEFLDRLRAFLDSAAAGQSGGWVRAHSRCDDAECNDPECTK